LTSIAYVIKREELQIRAGGSGEPPLPVRNHHDMCHRGGTHG